MSRNHLIAYSLSSGILMGLPWFGNFSGFFLLIAFIPILLIEDFYYAKYKKPKREVFLYASLTFLTWNTASTWWIANATMIGACTAIMMNTFLFSLIFWSYHITRKLAGNIIGRISFVVYWVAFEYFYLNAEISWPWLDLGNGFANSIMLIQWYEYTGTLGGTAWILLINIALYAVIKTFSSGINKHNCNIIYIISTALLILLPVTLSLKLFYNYKEKYNPYHITVIQPNIDPYNDKFIGTTPEQQLDTLLHAGSVNNQTDYFVGPETAIQGYNLESGLSHNHAVNKIKTFLQQYSKANFVVGAETFREYSLGESLSATAHQSINNGPWIDNYNTALQVDSTGTVQIYHKSKLVVGVEKMPYAKYLRFLEKYIINLGGIPGSRGTQCNPEVFYSADKQNLIAPVICYESAYGEYVTGYIKKGANIIFIMTNDGWFGNTPGHRQHLNYACLRAIETRRSIARSANTGISAFINQRGEILSSFGWGQRGFITASLNANNYLTFYVRHGDYLGKLACFLSGVIIFISIGIYFRRSPKLPSNSLKLL